MVSFFFFPPPLPLPKNYLVLYLLTHPLSSKVQVILTVSEKNLQGKTKTVN